MGIPGAASPLLLRRAAAGDDAYQIEKSLRFNDDDSPFLSRTLGTAGNRRTWTYSVWVKRGELDDFATILSSGTDSPNQRGYIGFNGDDNIVIFEDSGGFELETTAVYRDPSAWYHIVVAFDSTQATSNERIKLYVNGKQNTTWDGTYDNFPAQNFESIINSSGGNGLRIGGLSYASYVYKYDGLLADAHFIDGLALLSPAAFGSFDSLGVWNPKAFALPAPNANTTWSSGSVSSNSGNWYTGSGSFTFTGAASGAWDGSITTAAAPGVAGSNITHTFSDGISGLFRVYTTNRQQVELNSIIKHEAVNTSGSAWLDLGYMADVTSLKVTGKHNDGAILAAVEVDGVILVDGQTDIETRDNLNNGTTWSSAGTWAYNNAVNSGNEAAKGFNGDLSTFTANQYSADGYLEYTFPSAVTVNKKLEINIWTADTSETTITQYYTVNSESEVTMARADTTAPANHWHTLKKADGSQWSGSLTKLKLRITRSDGNTNNNLYAIRIDGHVLIDSTVDNSFHLKFNDTSLNRYLGKDTLKKISDCNGGLPIYNTDETGDVKGSGYRADSSAGTTDGAGLIFAWPGDTTTGEVHASINTGSSAKTLTVQGDPAVSTEQSRLYGSSIKFDKTGDYIQCGSDADYAFGTGQFTVELWFYSLDTNATNNQRGLIAVSGDTGGLSTSYANGWHICHGINGSAPSDNGISFRIGTATDDRIGGDQGTPNTWHHCAVTRDGSNVIRMFIDGVLIDSATDAYDFSTNNLAIAGYYSTSYLFDGYLQDIRLYKGTAKYTGANFTPPTRSDFTVNNLTHDDGTSASVFVSAATGGLPIYNTTGDYGQTKVNSYRTDANSANIVLAIAGDAITDEHDQVKGSGSAKTITNSSNDVTVVNDSDIFYGKALLFDSTSDALTVTAGSGSDFDFGSGDFTAECWLYNEAYTGPYGGHFFSMWEGGGTLAFYASADSNGKLGWGINTGGQTTAYDPDAMPLKKWTHFAAVRDGSTMRTFVNGVQKATGSRSGTMLVCGTFTIGHMSDASATRWNGKMAGIKIYKGVAKYGASGFTVVKNAVDAAAQDSLADSPTSYEDSSGDVHGNFCTLNPLDFVNTDSATLTQGNLTATGPSTDANFAYAAGTLAINSADTAGYYFEVEWSTLQSTYQGLGFLDVSEGLSNKTATTHHIGHSSNNSALGVTVGDSYLFNFGTNTSISGANWGTSGDVAQVAIKGNKIWWGKNNTWFNDASGNAGNPATGANPMVTLSSDKLLQPVVSLLGNSGRPVGNFNFGQREFEYTAPSGFKALCTHNLDNTFDGEDSENNPSHYFDVKTYTGNNTAGTAIKGFGFQPDLVWIKERNNSANHGLFDSVRGVTKFLRSNGDVIETTDANSLTAFDSDGFTLGTGGSDVYVNRNNNTYVAWAWDAGTAAVTASTDGSITPSAQWVNATTGFSITKYEGTEAAATVGHGLSAAPEFLIVKNLEVGSSNWVVWHKGIAATEHLYLNGSDAAVTGQTNTWNSTAPTSSVFSMNASWWSNDSGIDHIAYCWTPIAGHSAFGKFEGNDNVNGPFIYCGFQPRFFMAKNIDAAYSWYIFDTERSTYNWSDKVLYPDLNSGETTSGAGDAFDIVSNGIKLRGDGSNTINASGNTYIYAAFAEHPFKTARAR